MFSAKMGNDLPSSSSTVTTGPKIQSRGVGSCSGSRVSAAGCCSDLGRTFGDGTKSVKCEDQMGQTLKRDWVMGNSLGTE